MDTADARSPGRGPEYGSDLVVDVLRALGIEYAVLNPGATFRGLHDSLVNYGGNERPELIQCCHEEIAVAVAHGYAKAAGRPCAAVLHDVVGLQHASMAIFNAWCDRVPVLLLGGTGPMAVERRRPWIDWIHTALVQGTLVRDYVKWDDQPASLASIPEAIVRGYRIAVTEPQGPVYVCLDADLQEAPIAEPVPRGPWTRRRRCWARRSARSSSRNTWAGTRPRSRRSSSWPSCWPPRSSTSTATAGSTSPTRTRWT